MKRAPTSLKAIVGPWKSSSAQMPSSTRTTGMSKQNVSRTMRRSVSGSISSPKKASATRQAICTKERPGISRKNDSGKRSMRPGM